MGKEFNSSHGSDDEIERGLDELIEFLRPYRDEYKKKPFVPNEVRLEEIKSVYYTMLNSTQGTDAVVTYDFDEPEMSIGAVDVVGKKLEFNNPAAFADAAGLSDNMEVYPLVDGKVQVTFGFYGIASRI